MSHYKTICIHNTVVSQCRCMGPKDTRIVECPDHCKGGDILTVGNKSRPRGPGDVSGVIPD